MNPFRAAARRLPEPIRAPLRRLAGRSGEPADEFARFRSLDGPTLVRIPDFAIDDRLTADPRLVVLLPHLQAARLTGGPNTALNLAARVAASGLPVRCLAVSGPADPDARGLRAHVRELTGLDLAEDRLEFRAAHRLPGPVPIGRDDVFLATWWPTAHVARAATARVRGQEFLYLVQDFEPGFYPYSSRYALALATYGLAGRAIVNESLLLAHLREARVGIFGDPSPADKAIAFEPAVDPAVFRAGAPSDRPFPGDRARRLLFYARPRNERNLFELGLRALREVAATGVLDGWTVRSIGADLPPLALSASLTLEPTPWLGYRDYARLLAGSEVLLSPMLSPHTSYPPLEMAATGGLAVTTTFGAKTAAALAAISPRLRGVEPHPAALAAGLSEAIVAAERLDPADRVGGLDLPASWAAAFEPIVPWVIDAVAQIRAAAPAD